MDLPHIARDKPDALRLLGDGPVYRFHDWPNALLPEVAAGVYTIWREEALIYAGMAGRGFTAEIISGHRAAKVRNKGLRSRLELHWSENRPLARSPSVTSGLPAKSKFPSTGMAFNAGKLPAA